MKIQRSIVFSVVALMLVAVALPATPVAAQESAEPEVGAEQQTEDPTAEWRNMLTSIHEQLKARDYESAQELSRTLAGEMMEHLGAGSDAEYTMAVVAAFRAIAEAGLDNRDEALWYWRTAIILYPAFAERDLSVYGEPASWLASQPFRAEYEPPADPTALTPPEVERAPDLEMPPALEDAEADRVEIVLEAIVGTDGRPREPRILAAPEVPALIYTALETLKSWTFEPATLSGGAVPVAHRVTLSVEQ